MYGGEALCPPPTDHSDASLTQLLSRISSNELSTLPFLWRQRLDVELVAGAGIGVPAHVTNSIHEVLVNMQIGRVDGIAANEDAEDDLAG